MKALLLALLLFPRAHAGWEENQATPLRGELSFQDADLAAFLSANPRAAVYVWSPHMPLSARGMGDFLAAARSLGLPAVTLLDPQADEDYARKVADALALPKESLRRLRSLTLIHHAALLHYPSVLFFDGGKLQGEAIGGSRRAGWKAVLQRKLRGEGNETRENPLPRAVSAPVRIRKITPLPGNDFGYFIKPVWGTRWVALHKDWSTSYLFDLETGALVDTGYGNDVYVSPADHRYAVFWADEKGTLGLAETSEFLRKAADPSYKPAELLRDPDFTVYYQSIGLLAGGDKKSVYRVLTGSSEGPLLIRDYTILHRDGDAPARVSGRSRVTAVCTNFSDRGFGLPMLSKDGNLLAVNTDFTGRFGLVYAMSPRDPAKCTVAGEIDTPISKASFSFDGKRVAFAAGAGGVYVYEIATKALFRLEGFDALGPGTPLYPEFREDGSLIVPWLKDGGGISVVELEY